MSGFFVRSASVSSSPLALAVVGCLASGCFHTATTTSGTPVTISVPNIAKRLHCAADAVTLIEQGGPGTLLAEGCGNTEMYTQTESVWIPMQSLRDRSAFDLGCPADQLTLSPLSERQQGVVGCDKRAVYTYVRTDRYRWDWVMDSSGTSSR